MVVSKRTKRIVWAHRGASGYETDNTLEAFDLAFEQGADGIETDVRVSRDGVLFLFHDDYIDVEGKRIRPETLTMTELGSIELTADSGSTGAPRRIPTLEAVLARYRDTRGPTGDPVMFSLDVIPSAVGVAVADLAAHLGTTDHTVITPSDADAGFYRIVREIRRTHPSIPIVRTTGRSLPERILRLLPDRPTGFDWASIRRYNIGGLNFRARHVTAGMIARVRERGLLTYVWDCHDEETMRRCIVSGADALYTNYPDTLRGLIENASQ